ncbi:hypothetical protein B0H66DRAFT_179170 [Apodospora peruviana]|uniref:Rhodopsin domain-containing protein n=1 Tax=Apodospora peruviana TaxID=516989 RepID=A0AAE0IAS6_9PEZI|nr:hypothetical protein B0H66DRAFT_179170 [Apodospora peruviana]
MSTNITAPPSNDTAAPPPPPPPFVIPEFVPISERAAHLAQIYVAATSVIMALCLLAFVTRVHQRVRPVWKVGLDDYFIAAGFALAIADWGMLMPIMVMEPGMITWARSVNAGKNSWLAIGIWGLAMTCIKVSIALTLLRIQQKSVSWRIFLYSIMALQAIYGILNLFFNLVIACRPLRTAWDPFGTPEGFCVSFEIQRTVSNVGSSINITTDVLLSLAPVTFLFKLNRPLRERLFVCGLMGLGIFASAASIIKTIIVRGYGDLTVTDFQAMGVSICTWTVLEQLLGVLAACVPAMKGIFQSCLGRMGVSLNDSRGPRSGYYIKNNNSMGTGKGGNGTGLGTFQSRSRDNGDEIQMESRYGRHHHSKEVDSIDDDEECLDKPEARRNISTPKSTRTDSAGSFHHGSGDLRGYPAPEHLPAHAV